MQDELPTCVLRVVHQDRRELGTTFMKEATMIIVYIWSLEDWQHAGIAHIQLFAGVAILLPSSIGYQSCPFYEVIR